MNNLQKEAEAIQLSIYCDILCQILFYHRNLSINKLLPFAYLIKNYNSYKKSYTANDTNDLVYKVLSLMTGKFDNYCGNIQLIIKAIHLLILNGNIKQENDIIFFVERKGFAKDFIYNENSFFYHAIEQSKKMPEIQFLKEVVQNV